MALRSVICLCLSALAGCGSSGGNDVSTADDNDLTDPIGVIERELTPPIEPPTSEHIGASTSAVLAEAMKGLASKKTTRGNDGCTLVQMFNADDVVVVEHTTCPKSQVVRLLRSDGRTRAEYGDFDNDGKVDRFSTEDGPVAQYTDSNFDGKIDSVVERVSLLEDFSLEGYEGASYPKSAFLFRVREDRNRDGKLDFEKYTAKGALAR
jgi:hypothetical protein